MTPEYLRGVLTNNIDRGNDIVWDLKNKPEFDKNDPNVLGVIAVSEQIVVSLTALVVDIDNGTQNQKTRCEQCNLDAPCEDALCPNRQAALANGQPTSGVREAHEAFDRILRKNVIEECAKVCDRWIKSKNLHEHLAATDIARAIRALAAAPPARSKMAQRAPNTNPHATWQTVPLPATSEMTAAAELVDAEMRRQGFANAEPEAIYYAMLDAAPSPPVQGSSEETGG